jgi:hypothetical protein
MKMIKYLFTPIFLIFAFQTTATAQTSNLSETFKQHFNETVQNVKAAESAIDKRELLNESFDSMLKAIDRIERAASLNEDEAEQLAHLKGDISDKQNVLNGLDGFDEIVDEDLDDFSDYAQQSMEQANRTVTISLTSALLIVLILLLL